MDHDQVHNWVGNLASLGAIALSFAGILPAVAAIVAAVWYGIQVYESDTVIKWRRNRKHRKIIHLQAKLLMLQAEHQRLLQDEPTSTHDE
jgi:hypothetical protein